MRDKEIFSKKLPYSDLKQDLHVLLAVMNGEIPTLPALQDVSAHLSPHSYEIIKRICKGCWTRSPSERLGMIQIASSLSAHTDHGQSPKEVCVPLYLFGPPRKREIVMSNLSL